MQAEKPFWNPYVAGFALGLVLLASFVATGKGLGASGAFKHPQAAAIHRVNPTYAEEHPHIAPYFQPGRSALDAWIVFLAAGVVAGGAIGTLTGRRFQVETIHGPRFDRESRWVLAFAGGALSGFAAQLARGCTSGQAVTGGAQLALGSWGVHAERVRRRLRARVFSQKAMDLGHAAPSPWPSPPAGARV
ncbi:MAG: YeeE/YedE thiosulfate transporter family protein [bacterium]